MQPTLLLLQSSLIIIFTVVVILMMMSTASAAAEIVFNENGTSLLMNCTSSSSSSSSDLVIDETTSTFLENTTLIIDSAEHCSSISISGIKLSNIIIRNLVVGAGASAAAAPSTTSNPFLLSVTNCVFTLLNMDFFAASSSSEYVARVSAIDITMTNNNHNNNNNNTSSQNSFFMNNYSYDNFHHHENNAIIVSNCACSDADRVQKVLSGTQPGDATAREQILPTVVTSFLTVRQPPSFYVVDNSSNSNFSSFLAEIITLRMSNNNFKVTQRALQQDYNEGYAFAPSNRFISILSSIKDEKDNFVLTGENDPFSASTTTTTSSSDGNSFLSRFSPSVIFSFDLDSNTIISDPLLYDGSERTTSLTVICLDLYDAKMKLPLSTLLPPSQANSSYYYFATLPFGNVTARNNHMERINSGYIHFFSTYLNYSSFVADEGDPQVQLEQLDIVNRSRIVFVPLTITSLQQQQTKTQMMKHEQHYYIIKQHNNLIFINNTFHLPLPNLYFGGKYYPHSRPYDEYRLVSLQSNNQLPPIITNRNPDQTGPWYRSAIHPNSTHDYPTVNNFSTVSMFQFDENTITTEIGPITITSSVLALKTSPNNYSPYFSSVYSCSRNNVSFKLGQIDFRDVLGLKEVIFAFFRNYFHQFEEPHHPHQLPHQQHRRTQPVQMSIDGNNIIWHYFSRYADTVIAFHLKLTGNFTQSLYMYDQEQQSSLLPSSSSSTPSSSLSSSSSFFGEIRNNFISTACDEVFVTHVFHFDLFFATNNSRLEITNNTYRAFSTLRNNKYFRTSKDFFYFNASTVPQTIILHNNTILQPEEDHDGAITATTSNPRVVRRVTGYLLSFRDYFYNFNHTEIFSTDDDGSDEDESGGVSGSSDGSSGSSDSSNQQQQVRSTNRFGDTLFRAFINQEIIRAGVSNAVKNISIEGNQILILTPTRIVNFKELVTQNVFSIVSFNMIGGYGLKGLFDGRMIKESVRFHATIATDLQVSNNTINVASLSVEDDTTPGFEPTTSFRTTIYARIALIKVIRLVKYSMIGNTMIMNVPEMTGNVLLHNLILNGLVVLQLNENHQYPHRHQHIHHQQTEEVAQYDVSSNMISARISSSADVTASAQIMISCIYRLHHENSHTHQNNNTITNSHSSSSSSTTFLFSNNIITKDSTIFTPGIFPMVYVSMFRGFITDSSSLEDDEQEPSNNNNNLPHQSSTFLLLLNIHSIENTIVGLTIMSGSLVWIAITAIPAVVFPSINEIIVANNTLSASMTWLDFVTPATFFAYNLYLETTGEKDLGIPDRCCNMLAVGGMNSSSSFSSSSTSSTLLAVKTIRVEDSFLRCTMISKKDSIQDEPKLETVESGQTRVGIFDKSPKISILALGSVYIRNCTMEGSFRGLMWAHSTLIGLDGGPQNKYIATQFIKVENVTQRTFIDEEPSSGNPDVSGIAFTRKVNASLILVNTPLLHTPELILKDAIVEFFVTPSAFNHPKSKRATTSSSPLQSSRNSFNIMLFGAESKESAASTIGVPSTMEPNVAITIQNIDFSYQLTLSSASSSSSKRFVSAFDSPSTAQINFLNIIAYTSAFSSTTSIFVDSVQDAFFDPMSEQNRNADLTLQQRNLFTRRNFSYYNLYDTKDIVPLFIPVQDSVWTVTCTSSFFSMPSARQSLLHPPSTNTNENNNNNGANPIESSICRCNQGVCTQTHPLTVTPTHELTETPLPVCDYETTFGLIPSRRYKPPRARFAGTTNRNNPLVLPVEIRGPKEEWSDNGKFNEEIPLENVRVECLEKIDNKNGGVFVKSRRYRPDVLALEVMGSHSARVSVKVNRPERPSGSETLGFVISFHNSSFTCNSPNNLWVSTKHPGIVLRGETDSFFGAATGKALRGVSTVSASASSFFLARVSTTALVQERAFLIRTTSECFIDSTAPPTFFDSPFGMYITGSSNDEVYEVPRGTVVGNTILYLVVIVLMLIFMCGRVIYNIGKKSDFEKEEKKEKEKEERNRRDNNNEEGEEDDEENDDDDDEEGNSRRRNNNENNNNTFKQWFKDFAKEFWREPQAYAGFPGWLFIIVIPTLQGTVIASWTLVLMSGTTQDIIIGLSGLIIPFVFILYTLIRILLPPTSFWRKKVEPILSKNKKNSPKRKHWTKWQHRWQNIKFYWFIPLVEYKSQVTYEDDDAAELLNEEEEEEEVLLQHEQEQEQELHQQHNNNKNSSSSSSNIIVLNKELQRKKINAELNKDVPRNVAERFGPAFDACIDEYYLHSILMDVLPGTVMGFFASMIDGNPQSKSCAAFRISTAAIVGILGVASLQRPMTLMLENAFLFVANILLVVATCFTFAALARDSEQDSYMKSADSVAAFLDLLNFVKLVLDLLRAFLLPSLVFGRLYYWIRDLRRRWKRRNELNRYFKGQAIGGRTRMPKNRRSRTKREVLRINRQKQQFDHYYDPNHPLHKENLLKEKERLRIRDDNENKTNTNNNNTSERLLDQNNNNDSNNNNEDASSLLSSPMMMRRKGAAAAARRRKEQSQLEALQQEKKRKLRIEYDDDGDDDGNNSSDDRKGESGSGVTTKKKRFHEVEVSSSVVPFINRTGENLSRKEVLSPEEYYKLYVAANKLAPVSPPRLKRQKIAKKKNQNETTDNSNHDSSMSTTSSSVLFAPPSRPPASYFNQLERNQEEEEEMMSHNSNNNNNNNTDLDSTRSMISSQSFLHPTVATSSVAPTTTTTMKIAVNNNPNNTYNNSIIANQNKKTTRGSWLGGGSNNNNNSTRRNNNTSSRGGPSSSSIAPSNLSTVNSIAPSSNIGSAISAYSQAGNNNNNNRRFNLPVDFTPAASSIQMTNRNDDDDDDDDYYNSDDEEEEEEEEEEEQEEYNNNEEIMSSRRNGAGAASSSSLSSSYIAHHANNNSNINNSHQIFSPNNNRHRHPELALRYAAQPEVAVSQWPTTTVQQMRRRAATTTSDNQHQHQYQHQHHDDNPEEAITVRASNNNIVRNNNNYNDDPRRTRRNDDNNTSTNTSSDTNRVQNRVNLL